jgi:hypothetical protein
MPFLIAVDFGFRCGACIFLCSFLEAFSINLVSVNNPKKIQLHHCARCVCCQRYWTMSSFDCDVSKDLHFWIYFLLFCIEQPLYSAQNTIFTLFLAFHCSMQNIISLNWVWMKIAFSYEFLIMIKVKKWFIKEI